MKGVHHASLSRRRLFAASGAAAAFTALPLLRAGATDVVSETGAVLQLAALPSTAPLLGPGRQITKIWGYNGRVPGPALRFRQGDRLRAVVRNGLMEGTTVHWHGLRVPNDMDGMPGLTQQPILPGVSFMYSFNLKDAGTWRCALPDTSHRSSRSTASLASRMGLPPGVSCLVRGCGPIW